MPNNKVPKYTSFIILFIGFVFILFSVNIQAATILDEDTETGGKTSYAAANVTLGSGSWHYDDALTGSLTNDRKNDNYSARIRNSGIVSMNFNVASAGTVSIEHAKYGTNGTSTWELWQSTNNGSSWTKVGSTITTNSTTLNTEVFTVNSSNSIRFEIRKVSGGSNRLNIDDITITDYGTPPPPPVTTTEDIEAGGKTSYSAANVTLGTGSWYFDDALTGSLSNDRKNGSYSARIRNSGKLRMNFNVANADTVSIKHAKYGTNGTSTWELWKSTNDGSSWSKVGSTISTSSTTLTDETFTVNSSVAVRFEIRKVSGGSNRLNIDDIEISGSGTPPPTGSVHLTMGNPSNAVTNASYPTNYLMNKTGYALSYHRDNGRANWVSWHLDSSWLGSTPRQNDFRSDTTLPSGWYQVKSTDFSGSGYDRGHMTPSGDRTFSVADNSETFLMTNMIAQAPGNNRYAWAYLESYCRTLVNSGNELYIISGGNGTSGYIASGNVAVPTSTWKVIMVLPSGTNDVSRVTTSTRLIAIEMPNQNGISTDWRSYRVSVDSIEALTGHDFFSNVSNSVENVIEATIDNQLIPDSEMVLDKYAQEEIEAESRWNPKFETKIMKDK